MSGASAALPTVLLVSTALVVGAGLAPVRPDSEPLFVHLAEGFTSLDRESGLQAAQRWFSAPTLSDVCAPLEAPDRLALGGEQPVRLEKGEWFPYDRMIVVALDASDAVLSPVPISILVEQVEPPVLLLRSDMTAASEVLAIAVGKFRLRFATICEGHVAELIVDAEVIEQ